MGVHVKIISKDIRKHQDEVADALKEFKRLLKKEGLKKELKKRECYLSPSKAKRYKHNESIKQRKRDEKKNEWHRKNNKLFEL